MAARAPRPSPAASWRSRWRARSSCSARSIAASPLHGQIAAISVGICSGVPVLDLDYAEDSSAETDMNVVMNNGGAFVEIQGTAEGHAFRRHELDAMLNLAADGPRRAVRASGAGARPRDTSRDESRSRQQQRRQAA